MLMVRGWDGGLVDLGMADGKNIVEMDIDGENRMVVAELLS